MLKTLITTIIALFFFSSKSFASKECAGGWTFKNKKRPNCVPVGLNQSDSGWCFLFSAANLVRQKHCQTVNNSSHSMPSLRGILGEYNSYVRRFSENEKIGYKSSTFDWQEGGRPYDVLSAVNGKHIASEKCAPTSDFLSWAEKLPKGTDLSVTEILEFAYHKYLLQTKLSKLKPDSAKCELLQILGFDLNTIKTSQFALDIVNASASAEIANSNDFMSKVMVPPRCESDSGPPTNYTIKMSNPSSVDQIERIILNNLNSGNIISVSLCPSALKGLSQGCLFNGHAISVVGYRQKCCAEVCQEEYQILDSQTDRKNIEVDGTEWLEVGKITEGIRLFQIRSNEITKALEKDIESVTTQIDGLIASGVDELALVKAFQSGDSEKFAEIILDESQEKLRFLKKQREDLVRKKNGFNPMLWLENSP